MTCPGQLRFRRYTTSKGPPMPDAEINVPAANPKGGPRNLTRPREYGRDGLATLGEDDREDTHPHADHRYHDGLGVQHQKQDGYGRYPQAEAEGADHDGSDEHGDGRDDDVYAFRQRSAGG